MKKGFFIAAILMSSLTFFAQEPADALRYSWLTQSGTARQQAIGGAMGSLGGEISSTFVNPAGLGFYKTYDFVITPGFNFLKNKSSYLGRTEADNKSNLAFGTTGFVFGEGTNDKTKKGNRGSAFALAINRTGSFASNILYRGVNTQSSYSQKFLEEIHNNNDKDANSVASNYPFGTSLAFNTYWIDTIAGGTSGNYQFQSRAVPLLATGGLLQQQQIYNKGGITELALAGAGNFNDKLYVGGTLGIPFLHYTRDASFTEADPTTDMNNFDYANFSETLETKGIGLNLKAGLIYKPVEYLRLGFAIHSPSFFSMTDKYQASVTTNTENYQGALTQSSETFTGGTTSDFKYMLTTPYKLIASASYVLREVEDVTKQKGFITADVEFINYKASSFSPDANNNDQSTKDYLKSLNKAIDNAYKGAINLRVGGELKFTTVMVRLGAAYYGNPYKNLAGEKGSRLQLTGGLGYRNKGMFIDLAYVQNINKDYNIPYRLQYAPNVGATIKGMGGNAVLTVGFKI
jgi:hypothetical protein